MDLSGLSAEDVLAMGGRPGGKPMLIRCASHPDPDIAMAAVLGLLRLTADDDVMMFLDGLRNDGNDMIRDVIGRELDARRGVSWC